MGALCGLSKGVHREELSRHWATQHIYVGIGPDRGDLLEANREERTERREHLAVTHTTNADRASCSYPKK
jgi:hypothetical protein